MNARGEYDESNDSLDFELDLELENEITTGVSRDAEYSTKKSEHRVVEIEFKEERIYSDLKPIVKGIYSSILRKIDIELKESQKCIDEAKMEKSLINAAISDLLHSISKKSDEKEKEEVIDSAGKKEESSTRVEVESMDVKDKSEKYVDKEEVQKRIKVYTSHTHEITNVLNYYKQNMAFLSKTREILVLISSAHVDSGQNMTAREEKKNNIFSTLEQICNYAPHLDEDTSVLGDVTLSEGYRKGPTRAVPIGMGGDSGIEQCSIVQGLSLWLQRRGVACPIRPNHPYPPSHLPHSSSHPSYLTDVPNTSHIRQEQKVDDDTKTNQHILESSSRSSKSGQQTHPQKEDFSRSDLCEVSQVSEKMTDLGPFSEKFQIKLVENVAVNNIGHYNVGGIDVKSERCSKVEDIGDKGNDEIIVDNDYNVLSSKIRDSLKYHLCSNKFEASSKLDGFTSKNTHSPLPVPLLPHPRNEALPAKDTVTVAANYGQPFSRIAHAQSGVYRTLTA